MKVELVSVEDREAGGGAFYDEEGCAGQAIGNSTVGCDFQGREKTLEREYVKVVAWKGPRY